MRQDTSESSFEPQQSSGPASLVGTRGRRSPKREWLATVAIVALIPVLLLVTVPTGLAAHPTLATSGTAHRGATISVSGGGYEGRSAIQLRWDDQALLAVAHPDRTGSFELRMTVPPRTTIGEHNLMAVDPTRHFESRASDEAPPLASTIVTVTNPLADASRSPGPSASGIPPDKSSPASSSDEPRPSGTSTPPESAENTSSPASHASASSTPRASDDARTPRPTASPKASSPPRHPAPPPPKQAGDYLIISRARLLALPTSGSAYGAMKSVADGSLGTPNLGDRDSQVAARTLAAALVYARTGQVAYRDKVISVLRRVPGATGGMDVLSLSRQLAGYVISADLVDYRDASFVSWVSSIRTRNIGGHSRWYMVTATSENSANNWGAWAMASRIAASLYVGDTGDVARASKVFAGWLGDRKAYAGFEPTSDFDPSWACNPSAWTPVNPDCGSGKDGAFVEDISRSGGFYPKVDGTGEMYSWEVMGGATLSADLLAHNGYPSVWSWSNDALFRAASFLDRIGAYPPEYSVSDYIGWKVNKVYGVAIGPLRRAGYGRQFGYTDWLP